MFTKVSEFVYFCQLCVYNFAFVSEAACLLGTVVLLMWKACAASLRLQIAINESRKKLPISQIRLFQEMIWNHTSVNYPSNH